MPICDDFQLVNRFSERNDNNHKEIITFEIHEVVAQRFALPAADYSGRIIYLAKPMQGNYRRPPTLQAVRCTLC